MAEELHGNSIMKKTWCIINQNDEINSFKNLYKDFKYTPSFLTITPEAFFSLQNSKYDCKNPYEFVSKDQLNNLSEKNFNLANSITKKMDSWLHDTHPELPKLFNPFYAIEHSVKNFSDSIAFTLAEISGLCDKEKAEELIYLSNDNDTHHINPLNKNRYFSLKPLDKYVSSLVLDESEWWSDLGITTMPYYKNNIPENVNNINNWKTKISNRINHNRIDVLKQFRYKIPKSIFKNKDQRLLVIGKADNVIPFLIYSIDSNNSKLDWWVRDTYSPVSFPNLQTINLKNSNINNINFSGNQIPYDLLKDLIIEHKQLPIVNILYKNFQSFYLNRIPYLLSLYLKAQFYFKKYKPIAIISGTTDPDRIQIIHQASRDYNIPLISFQHGGAYGYTETKWIQLSDLRADIYAAYGGKSCEYIREFAQTVNMPTKFVNVGWENGRKLSENIKSFNQDKKNHNSIINIIYVPTGMMGDNRYGPNHDQMHDTKYCLEQIEIIKTLSQIPNTEITVKLHYKDKISNPVEKFINSSLFKNIKVLKYSNFVDLLNNADVIIIDCPTTVIIEALASYKNIIYINLNIVKFTNDGERLLKESVLWIEKDKYWENNLRKSVNEIKQLPKDKIINSNFMKHYADIDFKPENIWNLINQESVKL